MKFLVEHLVDIATRAGHWSYAFRRRFARQLLFLQQRISPEGYLGLHLTVGIVILLAAGWAFVGVTEDVVNRDPIVFVDQSVATWFQVHATPGSTRVMMAISFLGSGVWITTVAVLAAIYLLWQRVWDELLLLFLVSGCGSVLNVLIKSLFHRARPAFENPIQTLDTYSFPSGHTMAATLFYGLMAVFAVIHLRDWRARVLAVLLAVAMILLIGVSRMALVVHYFSDVLAAIAAGVVWLAFCVTAVDTLRRRRVWLAASRPISR